ncbi:MAG TPA: dihydroorotase, partial [Thermomonas sp.]|nr:dihydroorotase [Thermomonas sp.]
DQPHRLNTSSRRTVYGLSPFEGTTFHSRIAATWVNGVLGWDGERLVGTPQGQRLQFDR